MNPSLPRTVVLGGGIAGLEVLMALADLAAGRTELTLVAPDPDFHLKPMVVEEPFTSEPAERRELAPVVEGLGAKHREPMALDPYGPPGVQRPP